jgi:CHAT domain-containing protein
MARRINLGYQHRAKAGTMGTAADDYSVLFMKSNVSKTLSARLESGRVLREFGFAKLRSIGREVATLQACTQPRGERRIKNLTVIPDDDPTVIGTALQKKLCEYLRKKKYDVFHFSGHSFSSREHGRPFIVLPDSPGFALAMPISDVAKWLNEGGCHLMVLSSCQGASVTTAIETMIGCAEGVIGSRWEVNDRGGILQGGAFFFRSRFAMPVTWQFRTILCCRPGRRR